MALKEGTQQALQNVVNVSGTYLEGIGITPKKIQETAKVQKDGAQVLKEVATTPFDFITWVGQNWQLVVVGAVAILVLLRD